MAASVVRGPPSDMDQTWLSLYKEAPGHDHRPFLFENPAAYTCTQEEPEKKLVLALHIGSDAGRDAADAGRAVHLKRWTSQEKHAGTKQAEDSYRTFAASCRLHLQTEMHTPPSSGVKAAENVLHRLANTHKLPGAELAVSIYAGLLAPFCDYVVVSDEEHTRDGIEALLTHWPKYAAGSRWYRPRPALVVFVGDDRDVDGLKDRLVSAMGPAKEKGKTAKASQVKQAYFRSVDVRRSGRGLPQRGEDSKRSAMTCRQFPKAFHAACVQFSQGASVDLFRCFHLEDHVPGMRPYVEGLLLTPRGLQGFPHVLARAMLSDSYREGLPEFQAKAVFKLYSELAPSDETDAVRKEFFRLAPPKSDTDGLQPHYREELQANLRGGCLFCLRCGSSNDLACGHVVCDSCALGEKGGVIDRCPTCGLSTLDKDRRALQPKRRELRPKPREASASVLCLDGSQHDAPTIRLRLEALQEKLLLPLGHHFDAVVCRGIGIYFGIAVLCPYSSLYGTIPADFNAQDVEPIKADWEGKRICFKNGTSVPFSDVLQNWPKMAFVFKDGILRSYGSCTQERQKGDLAIGVYAKDECNRLWPETRLNAAVGLLAQPYPETRISAAAHLLAQPETEASGAVADRLIASLFYAEAQEPALAPMVTFLIRCREPPGDDLVSVMREIHKRKGSFRASVGANFEDFEICPAKVLKRVEDKISFLGQIQVKFGPQASGVHFRMRSLNGTTDGVTSSVAYTEISSSPAGVNFSAARHASAHAELRATTQRPTRFSFFPLGRGLRLTVSGETGPRKKDKGDKRASPTTGAPLAKKKKRDEKEPGRRSVTIVGRSKDKKN